jgi:hypothetical protein
MLASRALPDENPISPEVPPDDANPLWERYKWWVYGGIALTGAILVVPYVIPILTARSSRRNPELEGK